MRSVDADVARGKVSMNRRSMMLAMIGALTSAAVGSKARAQALDLSRPFTILVGFPAGGSVDISARLVAEELRTSLGATVVVENVTGAGGKIAVERAKNAPADGKTILVTPAATMTLYPLIYNKLSYDPVKDFIPVAQVCTLDYMLVISPKVVTGKVNTIADLAAWYLANPTNRVYGHGAAGSPMHFVGAMYGKHAKLDLTHVPYRGATLMIQDLLGGQIGVAVTTIADSLPHLKSGALKAIAVTGSKRSEFLPDVPTFIEQGADIVAEDWFGAFVRSGTPKPIVDQLNSVIAAGVAKPAVRSRLSNLAFGSRAMPQPEFAKVFSAEIEKWTPVVQATGFKIEE